MIDDNVITFPKKSEKQIEKAVCDYAKRLGWLPFKWVSPGHNGVPDRLFLQAGRVVFIEFKAPGKKPTPLQVNCLNNLAANGFVCAVIDNIADGKAFFNKIEIKNL